MRERPILFSGPMIRAILDGRKTQTRRVAMHTVCGVRVARLAFDPAPDVRACPYGVPGDRLWVRETSAAFIPCGLPSQYYRTGVIKQEQVGNRLVDREVVYRADGEDVTKPHPQNATSRWRPSIHMPRWASRLTLRITDVRVERLQDISEADARAEGVDWASPQPWGERWTDDDREDPREVGYGSGSFARDNFRRLWDSLNGRGAWDANPWVWVVAFERGEVPGV